MNFESRQRSKFCYLFYVFPNGFRKVEQISDIWKFYAMIRNLIQRSYLEKSAEGKIPCSFIRPCFLLNNNSNLFYREETKVQKSFSTISTLLMLFRKHKWIHFVVLLTKKKNYTYSVPSRKLGPTRLLRIKLFERIMSVFSECSIV